MAETAPIFLLADSQLLFWSRGDAPFIHRIAAELADDAWQRGPRAAYVGASNGDRPEFFELFRGAIDDVAFAEVVHVPAVPSRGERTFLESADLILLAGGDVDAGLRALRDAELLDAIRRRFVEGAVLVGVSAGAVQLGQRRNCPGMGIVPLMIDVHDDAGWKALEEEVRASAPAGRGIGIAAGGGVIFHADGSLEPVRRPAVELCMSDGTLRRAELLPP